MGVHYARTGSPVPLGVDFRGGTQVQVQFANAPDINAIRKATEASGIKDARIVNYDEPSKHEVLIGLPETSDATLDSGRKQIIDALSSRYNNPATIRNVQQLGRRSATSLRSRRAWRRSTRCWAC